MPNFYPMPGQNPITPTAPQSELYVCKSIPWDSDYNHVRKFPNEPALRNYLISMCPTDEYGSWHFTNMAPIRFGEVKIKIPKNSTLLMGFNYLMFANLYDAQRWFYAFITKMDWLSDNSCVIHYELDIYQCCAYRANYKSCFVEREHVNVANDRVGENLIQENLECGEMFLNSSQTLGFGQYSIGLLLTETLDGKQVQGKLLGNVYQGANVTILQDDGETKAWQLANGLLSNYNDKGKIDAIVDVFMIPELCRQGDTQEVTVSGVGSFEGYTPKNMKMYSYPYCYCLVDNNSGQTGIFKYEHSIQYANNVKFSARGELSPLPGVALRTVDYEVAGVSYLNMMAYTGFPQCSWNSDVYRAWSAQNKNTLALETASNAISPIKAGIQGAASGAMTGGLTGAIAGGVSGVLNGAVSGFENQAKLMATAMDKDVEPPQIHGKASNLNMNAALGLIGFNFYKMSCSRASAEAVDDYFTMYGYKVNKIKVPNLDNRPSWNFVKTINCGFDGELPPDMLKVFRQIFDRGVTIWHTNDMGNYGLNNR